MKIFFSGFGRFCLLLNSPMQKQILNELKELKSLLAKIIGTSDLPEAEQFSIESIKKATKSFQKLETQRSEWVDENEISKHLRGGDWTAAKFIRTEFEFRAVIKNGYRYLFNKKALQTLNEELKKRNVNLKRYIEYKRDEVEFQKKLALEKKLNKGKRPYKLPSDLKDITTSEIPQPSVELVRQDLENLKVEFFENKLAEYIDIYKDNHAMLKSMYWFEKYIEPAIKRRCKTWCDNFNYANHALELITKKKEKFVPVKEEDMISL